MFTFLEKIITDYNTNLPKIYNYLTLSNFNFSHRNIDKNVVIINLSGIPLKSNNNKFIYNFLLEDSDYVSYLYFREIMLKCCSILKMAEQKKYRVIVNCMAGVNRSVSVIVAYSITKGYNIDNVIQYIKNEKKNKYNNQWPTLTNKTFILYLFQLYNELNT